MPNEIKDATDSHQEPSQDLFMGSDSKESLFMERNEAQYERDLEISDWDEVFLERMQH